MTTYSLGLTIYLTIGLLAWDPVSSQQNGYGRTSGAGGYHNKVSVRVGEILEKQEAAKTQHSVARIIVAGSSNSHAQPVADAPAVPPMGNSKSRQTIITSSKQDDSWPPDNSDRFARVDVRVFGERVDSAALNYLKPSSDSKKLKRILGPDFQPDWMSAEKPSENASNLRPPTGYPKIDQKLYAAVSQLNFTFTNDRSQIDAFKSWLVQRASCPMDYMWENLGPTFWPQYIRRGVCQTNYSCSWPPGMRCRLNGSKTLKLLRWVCTQQNTNGKIENSGRQSVMESNNGGEEFERIRRHLIPGRQRVYRRQRRQDGTGDSTDRRSRRIRRLIKQLSVNRDGYQCKWQPHDYVISDQCSCNCP